MNVNTQASRPLSNYVSQGIKRLYRRIAILLGDDKQHDKNSIAVLDGVRAVAILLVIGYHINLVTRRSLWDVYAHPLVSSFATFGNAGVTLFFLLSGFLLFLPYARALLFEGSWPSALVFYLRRALRILPGYYLALFAMIVLYSPEFLRPDHLKDLLLFLTLFMDSSQSTFRLINGPFWTLAVEWQFYMWMPLLMLGLRVVVVRCAPERRMQSTIGSLLSLIILAVLVRMWGFFRPMGGQIFGSQSLGDSVRFFLYGIEGKFLEDFVIGMLISLIYTYASRQPANSRLVHRLHRLAPWLALLALLIVSLYACWHYNIDFNGWRAIDGLKPVYFSVGELFVALGFGAFMLSVLFGPPGYRRVFQWSYLRWLGLISYSIYIWHLHLLLLVQEKLIPQWPGLPNIVYYCIYWIWLVIVVLPFCFAVYFCVEKPWMHLSDWLKPWIQPSERKKDTQERPQLVLSPEKEQEREQQEIV